MKKIKIFCDRCSKEVPEDKQHFQIRVYGSFFPHCDYEKEVCEPCLNRIEEAIEKGWLT